MLESHFAIFYCATNLQMIMDDAFLVTSLAFVVDFPVFPEGILPQVPIIQLNLQIIHI